MHALTICAVGSPQEPWQKEALQTYLLRLRPFAKVECFEIPDERESPTVPTARLQAREADGLRRRLPKQATVVALDEGGRQLSSGEWAAFLRQASEQGQPFAFVLGGANGLDPGLRQEADHVLALGKHTLPHILARIVLLEQLYRAETILQGKAYHR